MAEQKKAPTVQDLQAQVEALQASLDTVNKLLSAQQPVLQPVKLAQDRDEAFQKKAAEMAKPCTQRTQEEAERRWGNDTPTRYPVAVADVPEIMVPARSPEEAKGRY